jgi:hypothetical protein
MRKRETIRMEMVHRCNYAPIHIDYTLITPRMVVHQLLHCSHNKPLGRYYGEGST